MIEKKNSKKNDAYSANADGVTIFIQNVKIAADHVERMNRVLDATKLETEVDELVAGHCPVPVRLIIDGALDTSINSIRQFAGYLRQSETGIENDHEFAVVCLGDDRVDEDGLTVGTGHTVDVCERLPMLIGIRQPVDLVHVQFRHGGDVLEPGDDFGDGELAGEGVGGVAFAVEQEGEVVLSSGVLGEDTTEDAVACISFVEVVSNGRARVGAQTNETFESLGLDVK